MYKFSEVVFMLVNFIGAVISTGILAFYGFSVLTISSMAMILFCSIFLGKYLENFFLKQERKKVEPPLEQHKENRVVTYGKKSWIINDEKKLINSLISQNLIEDEYEFSCLEDFEIASLLYYNLDISNYYNSGVRHC